MCEFCVQHGDGRIWYLEAANHSREIMLKLGVEEKLRQHARSFTSSTIRLFCLYDRLAPLWKINPLKRLAHNWATARQKRRHFGQVVPREHIKIIFQMAGSITRLPCVCRRFVKGRKEARYCFGLGFDPYRVYKGLPDYNTRYEILTPEEAFLLTERFQREEGLVHTIWTMPTPFVASVCNCSLDDCGAMLTNFKLGINVLFPGEMKAVISPDICTGCGRCLGACQYKALLKDRISGKFIVNKNFCQGCGVCRQVCPFEAIVLADYDTLQKR